MRMAELHTTLARIQPFYKQALVIELLVRPIRKHLPQSSVLIAQLRHHDEDEPMGFALRPLRAYAMV